MKGKKLGERLATLFKTHKWDEELFDELEDLLVEGDVGAEVAIEISGKLKKRVVSQKPGGMTALVGHLVELLLPILTTTTLQIDPEELNVIMFLGVNGVGKTTTLAKVAHLFNATPGIRSVIAAADTFRAGAIQQLQLHGERLGIRVVSQKPGADPGAVVYDTLSSARANGENLVLIDTAGRLHNREDLVRELEKIHRIVESQSGSGNYRKLLILDATTGQNCYNQAEVFHSAVGVDGIVMTKYDSAARGGVALRISKSLNLPFCYIGVGEAYDSLIPFDPEHYLRTLLATSSESS